LIYRFPAYRQHQPPPVSFPQLYLLGLFSADFTELRTFCTRRSIKENEMSGSTLNLPVLKNSIAM